MHGRSLKPYSLLRAAAWVRFPAPQPKFSMIKNRYSLFEVSDKSGPTGSEPVRVGAIPSTSAI